MKKVLYILIILTSFNSFGRVLQNGGLKSQLKTAIITDDKESQKTLSNQLKSQYSVNVLQYYRNELESIKNQSVLITNGLEDTYPLIILQQTESISDKTIIISLDLLNNQGYLSRIFTQLNLNQNFDKTSKSIYLSRLLSCKKTVFVSSTVNHHSYNQHSSHLFLVGLSLQLNSSNQYKDLNNFWNKIKKQNVNQLKLLANEKQLYSNYLPPLLTLYKLNVANDKNNKSLKTGIIVLSKLVNKEKTVTNILNQYDKGG